jgi:hypothetical protein
MAVRVNGEGSWVSSEPYSDPGFTVYALGRNSRAIAAPGRLNGGIGYWRYLACR